MGCGLWPNFETWLSTTISVMWSSGNSSHLPLCIAGPVIIAHSLHFPNFIQQTKRQGNGDWIRLMLTHVEHRTSPQRMSLNWMESRDSWWISCWLLYPDSLPASHLKAPTHSHFHLILWHPPESLSTVLHWAGFASSVRTVFFTHFSHSPQPTYESLRTHRSHILAPGLPVTGCCQGPPGFGMPSG